MNKDTSSVLSSDGLPRSSNNLDSTMNLILNLYSNQGTFSGMKTEYTVTEKCVSTVTLAWFVVLANICNYSIALHCSPLFHYFFTHDSEPTLPQSFLSLFLLLKERKNPPSCDTHNYLFPILQVHNKEYLCKANIQCSRTS